MAMAAMDSASDSGRESPTTSSPINVTDDRTPAPAEKTGDADTDTAADMPTTNTSNDDDDDNNNVSPCNGNAISTTSTTNSTNNRSRSDSSNHSSAKIPPPPQAAPSKPGRRDTGGSHGENGNSGSGSAQPTAFRPGRLTPLEILERLYPYQRRAVLELVLQGCNGDLVKAIEHFLSAQDTVLAQQQVAMQQQQQQHHHHNHHPHHGQRQQQQHTAPHLDSCRSNPFLNGLHTPAAVAVSSSSSSSTASSNSSLASLRSGLGAQFGPGGKLSYAGLKSAFTPLSGMSGLGGPGSGNGLHSAFSPHLTSLSALPGLHAADALRSSFMQQHSTPHHAHHHPATHPTHPHHHPAAAAAASAADLLAASPAHLAYAGLGGLGMGVGVGVGVGAPLPGMLAPPYAFHPYRLPLGRLPSSPPSARTPDKNSDRSALTDSDQVSDGWEEGASPREIKETD